jgi:hypothetical protein
MGLGFAVFMMVWLWKAPMRDLPSTGFCNEPLLGGKYAVCQETLTNFGLLSQETLIKTLLPQKQPSIKHGKRGLVLMKRKKVALILAVLLSSAVAGTQFVNLGQANPYIPDWVKEGEIPAPEGTLPPTILILSPENKTAYASHTVSLNVNITMTESNNVTLRISEIYYFASWLHAGKDYQRVDIGQGSFNLTGIPIGPNWIAVYAVATGFAYETRHEIEGIYYITYYVGYRIASGSLVNFTIDPIPPSILSLSVETYSTSNVTLNVIANEPVSQVIYSLDGQGNVTATGNTTLTDLPDGEHKLTVYVMDLAGNVGNWETIYFSIEVLFPTTLVVASVVLVAVVAVGLLVYFKKRKR